jgi:hypothetical protein
MVANERGRVCGYCCITREHKNIAFSVLLIIYKPQGRVRQNETRKIHDLGRICCEDVARLEAVQGRSYWRC